MFTCSVFGWCYVEISNPLPYGRSHIRRLSYLVERYQVIPWMHMGGRKLRSTEHALHTVVERIYEAWNGYGLFT